jgi:hypothetical protein
MTSLGLIVEADVAKVFENAGLEHGQRLPGHATSLQQGCGSQIATIDSERKVLPYAKRVSVREYSLNITVLWRHV